MNFRDGLLSTLTHFFFASQLYRLRNIRNNQLLFFID